MSDVILRERRGAIEILTVNRPKALNALNQEVMDTLHEIIAELSMDMDLRAVVLTGSGKAFVAGADIASMQELHPLEAEAFAGSGQDMGEAMNRLPVPIIAAVNGFALGGGCELAMCCDIVLAGERAMFGQPEVKLGVIPGFGGTQRLIRRVGMAKAMDLCLTGRMVKAPEAVQMGIASRLVEGDVLEAALETAETIAKNGPVAVRLAKRALIENEDVSLEAGLKAERSLFALCFSTTDQREGMAAFLGKRAADFTGQ
ncbi:MAG: enoyl-CoA hydratase [Myxococcota bacterium]|jgi:enoyl-CoA hydratase